MCSSWGRDTVPQQHALERQCHLVCTQCRSNLHCLRIRERIAYKIAVQTFKVLHGSHLFFVSLICLVNRLSGVRMKLVAISPIFQCAKQFSNVIISQRGVLVSLKPPPGYTRCVD